MENLLDRDGVCAFFGRLNPSTVYRHIRLGRIPKPVKIGGSSRWLREECEAALQAMVAGRVS